MKEIKKERIQQQQQQKKVVHKDAKKRFWLLIQIQLTGLWKWHEQHKIE
jgi:hypothetical protein